MTRSYVALTLQELIALRDSSIKPTHVVRAVSEDEQDEFDAMMTAAQLGPAVVAAELGADLALLDPEQVAAFHIDLDGSGDLAWFAPSEMDVVIGLLEDSQHHKRDGLR